MALNNVRAIDGDGHINERGTNLNEYLESPYSERAQGMTFMLTPLDGVDRNIGTKLFKGKGNSTESWLEAMEWGPLNTAVLYPTIGLFTGFIKDPDHAVAVCRAYNTWLAKEVCAPSGGRLKGVALLPPQDPEEAAKELRRARKELGHVAAMLPADGWHLLGLKQFHGIYNAAAEVDMAIAVHASGSLLGQSLDNFPKFIQAHTVSHPFSIMRQFTSMMYDGVFEKFPAVRFGFLETGGSWVPWFLDRLDEEFEHRGEEEAPLLKKKPSEYVHGGGNIFFGLEAEERLLRPTMDLLGDDLFLYASDWPHWDGDYPESLHEVLEREDLTEIQRTNIVRGAAERFYGLKQA
ncbi:MAG TPA: amidohydrolase family protein [Dehalococcoidia bacterium]|nr:amidohydrolase family protein [Dehalococcoidia bacterium]